jgi:hypothetical protein
MTISSKMFYAINALFTTGNYSVPQIHPTCGHAGAYNCSGHRVVVKTTNSVDHSAGQEPSPSCKPATTLLRKHMKAPSCSTGLAPKCNEV